MTEAASGATLPNAAAAAHAVVAAHEADGRRFSAAGVESFVLDKGTGEAVVCVHGVPASAYLYRKVVAELADLGTRGIAFDLPGLGFAGRPTDFDYSWTGLGRFATAAVDALGLDEFHLVVHDIGGPVGFEIAAAIPERIKSLTLLNTMIRADTFRRPWMMEPFAIRGIGEAWLASMQPAAFRLLMYYAGIADRRAVTPAELDAYLVLLKREDDGAAFLRIMRNFETTAAKSALYESVVADRSRPVQVVWGALDPALRVGTYGVIATEISGAPAYLVPGKHFFQEDQAVRLGRRIAEFVTAR